MDFLSVGFEIKSEDVNADGIFKGYGSTFGGAPDSYGDIMEKGAFKKSLDSGGRNGFGVAMLYQHNPDFPIGVWQQMREDSKGLYVEGKLALGTQYGKETYELMKMGALKGLSIGYDVPKGGSEWDNDKKVRYLKEVNLWEISPVTFPANTRAKINGVKVFEEASNIRELEASLRDAGLSHSQSKYIVSLCKKNFVKKNFVKKNREDSTSTDILELLKAI